MNAIQQIEKLSSSEKRELDECEKKIRHGLETFLEVGNALKQIRDTRLYRDRYICFEDYCKSEWDYSRSYVHRLIDASTALIEMLPMGNISVLPKNEKQARELASIKDPGQRCQAWQEALAEAEKSDAPLTAELVHRIVSTKLPPKAKESHKSKSELASSEKPHPTEANNRTTDRDRIDRLLLYIETAYDERDMPKLGVLIQQLKRALKN